MPASALPRTARITLDVTETLATGKWTGIERVVRRLAAELQMLGATGDVPPIRLVAAIGGRFHALNASGLKQLIHPEARNRTGSSPSGLQARLLGTVLRLLPPLGLTAQAARKERHFAALLRPLLDEGAADFAPGDVMVLLDSYWAGVSSIRAARRARLRGARVVSAIYDLIPITHPEYMTPFLTVAFPRNLLAALRISDAAIAISQTSAAELRRWLGASLPALPIGWFHLGNDGAAGAARTRTGGIDHYAVIGTIEPRKGHDLVLDAFERRWARGDACTLTIVGRIGWAPATRARLAALAGEKRLRVVHDADDARLATILGQTDAVVMASRVEGFGLPIVEALALDIPVIASDIAIFREVGGDAVIRFAPDDAGDLVAAMERLEADPDRYRARARAFAWPTWREAARRFAVEVEALPARGVPSAARLD